MDDRYTIQINPHLVSQLATKNGDKLNKKTKKPKAKVPIERQHPEAIKEHQKKVPDDLEKHNGNAAAGWPVRPPFFVPVNPPVPSGTAELNAIQSTLERSEKVLERLKKQEDEMLQEVSKKAKDLHDKEFSLPEPKTIPCLEQKNACTDCYKENLKNPLKCASVVESFRDCARRFRQQMGSPTKLAS